MPQEQSQLNDGMNGGVADQEPSRYFVSKSSGDWGNISYIDDRAFSDNCEEPVNVNLALNGRIFY